MDRSIGASHTLSPERIAEATRVIGGVTAWAARQPDVVGLLLVGSYARDAARSDSDIDLLLLSTDETRYDDDAWVHELAIGELIQVQSWGAVTERRLRTPTDLEVEINIGSSVWADTDPVDPGTRRVVSDGARALHDPTGALADLISTCRSDRHDDEG